MAAILNRLLGRYVLGLEVRNLSLKVWSGRVVLENLSLRQDALIGLPVRMRTGTIGRLEMVVPWHKLGSLPVTLDLQDVFVLVTPLNEDRWRPEEEAARRWSKKHAALRTRGGELRELLEKLQGSLLPEGDDDALAPGLLPRVLDNVQMTVSNVHLRYEDRTNSSTPVALGLRLVSVQLKAVDEHGRTRFVERAQGKPMRKTAAIKEFSAYLEVGCACARQAERSGDAADNVGAGAAERPHDAASRTRVAGASQQPQGAGATASASGAPSSAAGGRGEGSATHAVAAAHALGSAAAQSSSRLSGAGAASGGDVGGTTGGGGASAVGAGGSHAEVLRPISGRLLLVLDPSRHRPPGVPMAMAQLDFDVASLRLTRSQ